MSDARGQYRADGGDALRRLSGGSWSLDAADFRAGDALPAVGLTVIELQPEADGQGHDVRAAEQARRLRTLSVHIPGMGGPKPLTMPRRIYDRIRGFAEAYSASPAS